jgi:hypothetical protein
MDHKNNFFFTGCMIISLAPAGYANLISDMCCYYYIIAARSCSEETLSACLTAQNFQLALLLKTEAVMIDIF